MLNRSLHHPFGGGSRSCPNHVDEYTIKLCAPRVQNPKSCANPGRGRPALRRGYPIFANRLRATAANRPGAGAQPGRAPRRHPKANRPERPAAARGAARIAAARPPRYNPDYPFRAQTIRPRRPAFPPIHGNHARFRPGGETGPAGRTTPMFINMNQVLGAPRGAAIRAYSDQ